MKALRVLSPLVVMIAACGERRQPPLRHEADPVEACNARAAELRSYLIQVFDPTAKPAPPWPTGDAELDKKLDAARDALRKAMNMTPEDEALPLGELPKRGPVDDTLAGCPQARHAWENIASFPGPDHLTKAAIAIGDGVAACGCRIDIPLIRAALYLMARGPD